MNTNLPRQWSWLVISAIAACMLIGSPSIAQEGAESDQDNQKKAAKGPLLIPTPKASELGLEFPEGVKPKRENDETLIYTPPSGSPMVVKLHSTAGNKQLVKFPSGKLKLVDSKQTKPTAKPFVAATATEMVQAMREEGFDKYKIVEADPYVFVYACSEAFYMHTRSILESLYPGIMDSLKAWELNPKDPETPLVVIITPNRKAFDTYQKMPEGVAAYYSPVTHYIVLYEDTDLAFAAPEFGLKQGAYTIAHEGVHQILAATGIQERMGRWPMWISEGLPEYFCPLKVSSRLVRQGTAELPERTLKWQRAGTVNDLRMWDLLQTPTSDEGDVIKTVVSAQGLTARGYSLAWGLTHYLATRKKKEFQAYLKDVSQIEAFDTSWDERGRAPDPLFVKHFGDQFSVTEYAVAAHLTDKKMQSMYKDPFEYQTHYIVKRILKKGRSYDTVMVITTSPEAAKKWKEEEEAKLQAADETARFYTIICETRNKAEYQIRKVMSR